jgi:hypothetical protein
MPSNPRGRPVLPSMLRRRGLKRMSAVTTGVGVASVLATGAIAAALPGSTHHSGATGTGGTGSGASAGSSATGSGSGSASSGGSGSAFTPATSPSASSGGANATSGAS